MDLNIPRRQHRRTPTFEKTMINLYCPTIDSSAAIDEGAVLSTHRTVAGQVAYARCACGGLVLLESADGSGWQLVAHGRGRAAVARAAVDVLCA